MTDEQPQDDVMRQAVIGELVAIAFGNPRRVSARDRLAALKLLGEVKGLWLQQQVTGKATLAEALERIEERRKAHATAEGGDSTIGAVVVVPGKSTDWAQLAFARQDGLAADDMTVAPAGSDDLAGERRRGEEIARSIAENPNQKTSDRLAAVRLLGDLQNRRAQGGSASDHDADLDLIESRSALVPPDKDP